MKRKQCKEKILSLILGICILSTMLLMNACSKSTDPTKLIFTALPYAGVDFSLGFAEGINNDGTIVVGGSAVNTPDGGKYMEIPPVYWTDDVVTVLPFPGTQIPGFERQCAVYDISNTGVMVGNQGIADLTPVAFYYANDQWNAIIDPSSSMPAQTATGISGNGNILVGLSANAREDQGGYYYNVATGEFTILASTFGDSAQYTNTQTSLFDISEDGMIMVGSDIAEMDTIGIEIPIYFDRAKDTSATRLPLPSGYENGIAKGISADGSTITGVVFDDDETPYAAYWDNLRQVHLLGTFSPYPGPMQPASIALAASDNGDRIVGTSYDIAFIKFKNDAMFSLQDWLEDEGLSSELADWDLIAATAITPDGHWIAGVGRDGVYTRAFKVYIP
ncbi:MAG: hypothetical protein JXA98_09235 [Methanosarcinaceae archaeon]|nr:hypothetical protein [Methanosarcinaceae archaeon]